MKILNIIAVVLSVLLIVLSFYYIDEMFFLRWYSYSDYNPSNKLKAEQLTFYVGLFSLLFFIPFLLVFIKQLKLYRSISVFGIIFTAIIIIWDFLMLSYPEHISFDEVGLAWMAYGAINIVLFILLLRKKTFSGPKESDEVIDDFVI